MSNCCKEGFKWNGSPVGKESTVAGKNVYVTGDNKDAAVLLVHDVFGWTLPNLRLLADHYAKEANVTAYLPDLFVSPPPAHPILIILTFHKATMAKSSTPKPSPTPRSAKSSI